MNEFVKLSDLCILITKGSTPTTYGYSFKNEGIPFIKAEALNGDVSLDVKGFSYIDDETHNFLKRSKIYPNDILMTIAGANIGKTGFVRENISEANTNQAVAIIRLDKEKVCPQFYYYYFKQKTFFKFVQSLNAQAAQPNINLKMIGDFLVPKLEIDTQLKVVSILGTIDDLYLCNLDRITKSKQIILNLYQEWFINFKFPNHEQVKFVDGIPEGWEYNELVELFVLQRGFDLSNSKRILGDVPIYASTGIVGYHNEHKVLEKTVITGRSGSLGEVMITNGPSWPLNTTLWVKDFKKFTPEMAYFTLKNLGLESFNAGAAVPTLNRNDVHKVKVLTPTKEIIDEFSKLASQIFDQIHLLKLKNEKLVELKETLLPRLMSGELDVSKLSSIE